MKRALFFDRDGTLIRDLGSLARPDLVQLCAGASEALRSAAEMGFEIVIVSNQSGVARGYYDEAAVEAVNRRMIELLGTAPRAAYFCFHHPKGIRPEYALDCDCRKPKPGLLLRAERELGISLPDSVIVGDSMRDLMAGRAAGTRTVLVLTGEAAELVKSMGPPAEADFVAADLRSALKWVRTQLRA
jgi:D,D-heptose 1,7-bisphosphate phosphatase